MKRLWMIFLLLGGILGGSRLQATHIVGAELYYECVDSLTNKYEVTLKLYRDCINGQAPYDLNITLFIFNAANGTIYQTVNIPVPPTTPQIQPTNWSACVAVIPNICVEEGIYRTQITLPPNANGYNLGWSRCCRNQNIDNLLVPLQEGITFLARVPGTVNANCNNMPIFDQVPPIFLCVNQPFNFDHSATDVDGDSLVYSLVNPYTGTNFSGQGTGNPQSGGNSPTVDPFNNLMGPPPYNSVAFAPGYGFTNPFGSNNFIIDPQTGFITVTPNQIGIFVFAISVFEYRNGVLLSENRRDFQIHIIPCLPPGVPPNISHNLAGTNFIGDTIFVTAGAPFCYDVTVTTPVANAVLTAYTVSAPFGNGNFFPPKATFTFSGNNPILGQVCWTPACAYNGQLIPLIIGAYDQAACQNFSNVFDTVWIKVTVPPNQPPIITPNLSGLTVSNDTIIVQALNNFCFPFTVVDPNANDVVTAFGLSPVFNAANGPTLTVSGTNPVTGQVCWTPDCSFSGQTVELKLGAQDLSPCNNALPSTRTLYVRVVPPPNNPPSIVTNLNGNIFSNDTIYVEALNNLCFTFTATDPDANASLSFQPLSPIFSNANAPVVTTNGSNPLTASICWTPSCDFVNQVIPFIVGVQDPGACNSLGLARDTVYVNIAPPANAGPSIVSNLAGNLFSNDTIFINANTPFCYSFVAADPNGDPVSVTPLGPIFSGPNPPVVTTSGSSPVTGTVCWNPGCELIGAVIPLVLAVEDQAVCNQSVTITDTVYIQVNLPPNAAPVASTFFNGLTVVGDTIFVDATDSICFNINFSDINTGDILTPFTVSPIFSDPNGPSFSFIGVNPVLAQVCWTPGCDYEGQLVELIVGVEDDADCNNEKQAFDTVYIKISDPLTIPPVVSHDLTGLNAVGDTVYIEIGDQICYDFFIADQTPDNGMTYTAEFQDWFGSTLTLTTLSINIGNDSITGTVCFLSDCSNGGTVYRSIITGIDKETCPPFKETKDTVWIKVNTPFMSFAGRDTSFCEGSGGVQINATPIGGAAPYYYKWWCSNPGQCGLSSPSISNPIVNPTDTTIYYVQITDKNGCTSEIDGIQVNVKRLPIADAGPDQYLCEGGPGTKLGCTILNPIEAPGPYTYQWIPATGLSNPTVIDPYAAPDTTTIYTVIVGSINGCTSDNTTLDTLSTVTVFIKARPTVEAGPDLDVCFGDSTMLLGFASQAGPTYTYVWTPSTGVQDSSQKAPMASPPQTTTYFLVAWSNGCPSEADSATVNVRTLPTADPGIAYEICAGDTIAFSGVAGGDTSSTYHFQWSPALGLSDPNASKPLAFPTQTTTYELYAVSSFGCEGFVYDVTVHVNPTPMADAGPDTTLCFGDTLQMQGGHTMLGGSAIAPVFYEWTNNQFLSGKYIPNPLASPTETIVYELIVSSGACSSTDIVKIDVIEAVQVSVRADTSRFCAGDSVQLTAIGGRGNATFIWYPATGLSDPGSATPMAAPDQSITYRVVAKEVGCSGSDSLRLTVNPAPLADFASSLAEGCADLEVAFFEQADNARAYIWYFGDESQISNEPNPTHIFTEPGVYEVSLTVIGTGGCTATSDVLPVVVFGRGIAGFTSSPDSDSSLYLPFGTVNFRANAADAASYFWDFGDGGSSGEQNPVHHFEEAGVYPVTLRMTDAGGCVSDTTILYQVLDPNLQIPNVFTPNGDGIQDTYLVRYQGGETFLLDVYDRWGRPMYSGAQPDQGWNGLHPNGSQASEGVYFYVVTVGGRSFRGNLTLMR
ncbi:MAG: PKD domain-containing protein [Bacteroidia bacterium]|nr:PKD domain-containing protein [Bacteroidia bacterium]